MKTKRKVHPTPTSDWEDEFNEEFPASERVVIGEPFKGMSVKKDILICNVDTLKQFISQIQERTRLEERKCCAGCENPNCLTQVRDKKPNTK